MEKNLTSQLDKFESRKNEHDRREMVKKVVTEAMEEYEKKLEDLKETKTWITQEEREDVSSKMKEIQEWLNKQLEEQATKSLHEDPVFKSSDAVKKM